MDRRSPRRYSALGHVPPAQVRRAVERDEASAPAPRALPTGQDHQISHPQSFATNDKPTGRRLKAAEPRRTRLADAMIAPLFFSLTETLKQTLRCACDRLHAKLGDGERNGPDDHQFAGALDN